MKFIAALVCILCSAVALATPKIGDFSSVSVSINGTAVGNMDNEIVQFDQATNKFLQKTTQNIMGQTKESQGWVEANSDEIFATILSKCAEANGTLEDTTVIAGVIATCALPVSNENVTGKIWIGAVPFGIVKADISSGGYAIYEELSSFKFGK